MNIGRFAAKHLNLEKDVRGSLEKIVKFSRTVRPVDWIFNVSKFYNHLLDAEKLAEKKGWNYVALKTLEKFDIKYKIIGKENIPDNGSTVYVANHPWGIPEGLILMGGLGKILNEENRKLKLLVSIYWTKMLKGIDEALVIMENNNGFTKKFFNTSSLKKLITHMKSGGDFAFFPAGNTSYYHDGKVQDPAWSTSLENFSQYSDKVVPMYFSGPKNGALYRFLSRVKPKARDLALLKELTNKKGKEITLRIGVPITRKYIEEKEKKGEIGAGKGYRTAYIREKCEELAL